MTADRSVATRGGSGPAALAPGAALPLRARVIAGLVFMAGAMTLVAIVALRIGTFSADLSGNGDSSAHYVNGLLVRDYLAQAGWRNPLAFATEYYRNFPRVTIGHWPPGFYLVEGPVQLLFGRGLSVARVLQITLLAGLGTLAMLVVASRGGLVQGALCGAAVVLTPELLRLANFIMADTFTVGLVTLAALAWARHAARPGAATAMLFAALALMAILSKGSAIGLALLPPLHCALTGQWRLLWLPSTWLSALVVGVPAGIWYGLTASTAADGFVYAVGLDYTTVAVAFFARALLSQAGVLVPLFLAALVDIARRARRGEAMEVDAALAASALAILLFTLVLPADIQVRYLVGVLPQVIVVACLFSLRLLAALAPRLRAQWLALGPLLVLNLALLAQPLFVLSLEMHRIARAVVAEAPEGAFVLALTSPHGEGGLIAAFAEIGDRRNYVVRGTKLLASGTFMGVNYQTLYATPQEAQAAIMQSPIEWLVLESEQLQNRLAHVEQLLPMLQDGGGWQQRAHFDGSGGTVLLFQRLGVHPLPEAARAAFIRRLGPTKLVQ